MKAHVKDNAISVLFNDEEHRELTRVVEAERRRRKDVRFGKATLIRELVMPLVRDMAESAEQVAA